MLGRAARLDDRPADSVLNRLPQHDVITLGCSSRKYKNSSTVSIRIKGAIIRRKMYFFFIRDNQRPCCQRNSK